METTVQYEPGLRACPFCAESLEGVEWKDHFILQYAEIRMGNADVLFASLVCRKLVDQINRDEGGVVHSEEVVRLNMWIPLQAIYREPEEPLSFHTVTSGRKEWTN